MNISSPGPRNNNILIIIVGILIVAGLVWFLQNPQTTSKKINNVAEDTSYNIQKAGRGLDPDRSLGEKVGDAAQDVSHEVDKATRDE